MKRSYSSDNDDQASAIANTVHAWNHDAVPALASLTAPVSPPRKKATVTGDENASSRANTEDNAQLSLAAVEAGQVEIDDPVELFLTRLSAVSRPISASRPERLSIEDWVGLYRRNQHENGHHFVIHQHDHPIAGPHYDLRLQISESSSLSWAIMYGLPGDPNSRRINRNATETRVHCLWVSI